MNLHGKQVVLGVCGGIAAYKSPDLVRRLREAGALVRVVLTAGGAGFVTPLTFQAVSGNPVHQGLLDPQAEAGMGHIELARWADMIVIAPATANILARLAAGLADDLLSTLCLASAAPQYACPAMNQQMWQHPATQTNLATLSQRGVTVLGPGQGDQACGDVGPGRMLEPTEIVQLLVPQKPLLPDIKVVVTAGPTYEDIDPVRFIGNRSSGKMGFAVATAARAAGAEVILIAGPSKLSTPLDVKRIDVRSAAEMAAAVDENLTACDIYISAAAVADYSPVEVASEKIKKQSAAMRIELAPTLDILQHVANRSDRPMVVVGFAAETQRLKYHARTKLENKGLDLIAANQVGAAGTGFDADENAIILISSEQEVSIAKASKKEIATALITHIAEYYDKKARSLT